MNSNNTIFNFADFCNLISKIFPFTKEKQPLPVKIAYVVESTQLYGGVKVIFRQAEALSAIGFDVTIICNEPYPDWFEGQVKFSQKDHFDNTIGSRYDILITCGFRLNLFHYQHRSKAAIWQLIQGYEGDFDEALPFIKQIEEAYLCPVPKMAVSERLCTHMKQKLNIGNIFNVDQGIEKQFFFPAFTNLNTHYIGEIFLFLIGPFEDGFKQIKTGLQAFLIASSEFPNLKLIRISIFDNQQQEEEFVGPIDNYFVNISPRHVGELLRSKPGLLLAPSVAGEGFGLPPIEAMACGVPTVMTKIPSFLSFDVPCDYAEFVEVGNSGDMACGISEVIRNHSKRQHFIQKGIEVAGKYSYSDVARNIEKVLTGYSP